MMFKWFQDILATLRSIDESLKEIKEQHSALDKCVNSNPDGNAFLRTGHRND